MRRNSKANWATGQPGPHQIRTFGVRRAFRNGGSNFWVLPFSSNFVNVSFRPKGSMRCPREGPRNTKAFVGEPKTACFAPSAGSPGPPAGSAPSRRGRSNGFLNEGLIRLTGVRWLIQSRLTRIRDIFYAPLSAFKMRFWVEMCISKNPLNITASHALTRHRRLQAQPTH